MSRMRLTISALLLASAAAVAAPALAQDWHHDGGNQGDQAERGDHGAHGDAAHGGRSNGGGRDGGQQSAPPQRAEDRPQPQAQQRQQGGMAADRGNNYGGQPRGGDPRGDAGRHVEGRADNGVQVWRDNDRGQARRPDWQNNGGDRGRPGGWDQSRQAGYDRDHGGGWNGNRGGDRGGDRNGWDHNGGGRGGDWNNGWRNDRRYDWQGWRNSHRDAYRAGQYRVPYGYHGGYRRWGLGVRIDPIFFGQDYWIDNPGYYRLPPAYGDYRWVRYYNDALLVDVYSGTVIDEIPDFFW